MALVDSIRGTISLRELQVNIESNSVRFNIKQVIKPTASENDDIIQRDIVLAARTREVEK